MTAVSVRASTGRFDLVRSIRLGSLGGLTVVFIALAGMPVGLDDRTIIEPVLSLGYLALIWVPVLLGHQFGKEAVLEGIEARPKGAVDVVGGAVVGLLSGASLSGLLLLIDNFDLRDPLVNWSPQLLDLLAFDKSVGFGVFIWFAIGVGLGAAGGAIHLLGGDLRRLVRVAVVTVLTVSILESIITDLLEGFQLDFATDAAYAKRGGLTVVATFVLAVVAAVVSVVARGAPARAKDRLQALEGRERVRANAAILLAVGGGLIVLPLFLGRITNELLANVGLFVLLALGLNVVVGLAGILDLGYVAFFAVGGYTTAVLTSPNTSFFEQLPSWMPLSGDEPAQLPWFVAVLVVIVLAAIVGLLIGTPVIRMRGDYLAIVTLGFGEIIRLLFLSDWLSGYFGGAQGITNIPPVDVGFGEVTGIDPRSVFWLVLAFCALAVYISWRLERSRIGRAWMAIREDESVAEAMGINTVTSKLMAFIVGAILAAFSGAIFATKVGSIFPSSFLILVSIIILVVVIVGGMGNIVGVIVGAIVLIGILGGPRQPGLLQEFSQFKLLIYGALLVWMMLKRPEGLVPNVRRTRELHQAEFLQDAWLKGEIDEDDDEGVPS